MGIDFGQFVADTLANEGASVNLQGEYPKTGYMVATTKLSEERVSSEQFTPEFVRGYVSRHTLPHLDCYIGAWQQGGEVVLDVSHNIQGLDEAVLQGQLWDQDAIYDVEQDRTIYLKAEAAPDPEFAIYDQGMNRIA